MPAHFSRHIALTQPLADFLDSQVAGGAYSSASEVVREALRLMLQRAPGQASPSTVTALAHQRVERERFWQLSNDMLGVADDEGVWLSINPAWTRALGWQPEDIIGRTSEWMEHPDDVAKTRAEILRLAAGNTTFAFQNRFRTRAGDYRTLSWTAVPEGGLLYCVTRDITDAQQRVADDAEDLAAQERLWAFSPDLLSVIDMPSGHFDRVNPAWIKALGWAAAEIEGKSYEDFVHPDDMGASLAAFEHVRDGNPVLRFENCYRTKGGDWRRLSWVAFPEGSKLYSTARDITDERQQAQDLVDANELIAVKELAEEQQRTLQTEMAHRIKNTLSMVMAIVSQTMRHATSMEEAGDTIGQRISALSSAQDLLRQTTHASALVGDVVQGALKVHLQRDDRVTLEGPQFTLPAQPALGLSLAIHELATNAVKYGALANERGHVRIAWRQEPGSGFHFEWREEGGPPVTIPSRKGFGSRLINAIVPSYFHGRGHTSFAAEGLTYVLDGTLAEESDPLAEPSGLPPVAAGDSRHAR